MGESSAEKADFAARWELSDEREEAVERAFAAFGESDKPTETQEVASEQEETPNASPTNRVAPVAVEETPDEAEVVEREQVERERSAALEKAERARKAEERKEGKRLGKYDESPSRLSKYDR